MNEQGLRAKLQNLGVDAEVDTQTLNLAARASARAADLVERGWLQHEFACDRLGLPVRPTSPDACAWCLTGALGRAFDDLGIVHWRQSNAVFFEIGRFLPAVPEEWNDEFERTQADVADALHAAATGLAAELGGDQE